MANDLGTGLTNGRKLGRGIMEAPEQRSRLDELLVVKISQICWYRPWEVTEALSPLRVNSEKSWASVKTALLKIGQQVVL